MKPLAPYFDERFTGYGNNKIQHVSHLRVSGYKFSVLPEGFIVHNPHVNSEAREQYKFKSSIGLNFRYTMDMLYKTFYEAIAKKYQHKKDEILSVCPKTNKQEFVPVPDKGRKVIKG